MSAAQLSMLPEAPTAPADLAWYDVILVNSSGGKDSQAMLDVVAAAARDADVLDRLVVVHADLGDMEWEGTRELAERQAAVYDLPFRVVRNRSWRDLLERIESRGQWPSSTTRYCTSEFKTGQVRRLMTELTRDVRARTGRQARILNCLGIRAQESPARSRKQPFHLDHRNSRRHVDRWLPIFEWSEADVWARIAETGVEHHRAYDLGQTRLSCRFCVLASRPDLVNSVRLNRQLADRYVAAEQRMNHTFQQGTSMADLVADADALDASDAPLRPATSSGGCSG